MTLKESIADKFAVEALSQFVDSHGWRSAERSFEDRPISNSDMLSEFAFCLLGGYSITYEMNSKAHEFLATSLGFSRETMLDQQYVDSVSNLLRRIPTNNGVERRFASYRFPHAKAKSLHAAAKWLEENNLWDLDYLLTIEPFEAREIVCQCPGIGYKTASWFLRNIGHGRDLAIVDVHIHRLAIEWLIIPFGLTPQKNYKEIESRLRYFCKSLDLEISDIDLVMWQYSRGDYHDNDTGQLRLF